MMRENRCQKRQDQPHARERPPPGAEDKKSVRKTENKKYANAEEKELMGQTKRREQFQGIRLLPENQKKCARKGGAGILKKWSLSGKREKSKGNCGRQRKSGGGIEKRDGRAGE